MDAYEFIENIVKRERAVDRLINQDNYSKTLYKVDNTHHVAYGEGQKKFHKIKTMFKKMNMGISREAVDKK